MAERERLASNPPKEEEAERSDQWAAEPGMVARLWSRPVALVWA